MDSPVDIASWLKAQGAHHDFVSWATSHGSDWEGAWQDCTRGDWLFGWAARCGVSHRMQVEAAISCARFALPYLPDSEQSLVDALERLSGWCLGDVSLQEIQGLQAQVERRLGALTDPALHATCSAIHAALMSADDAESVLTVPVLATQAAVFDATDCGMISAMRYAQYECANRVRAVIPFSALVIVFDA